ncbi:glycosyltransferase [bacterium]|nr:glycosyltransferase [bacterium]
MDTLYERNRRFLESRYPGLWDAYRAARPIPADPPRSFSIPLPDERSIALPVNPKAFVQEYLTGIGQIENFSGALIWGVGAPSELELFVHDLQKNEDAGRRPFLYVESDPAVFGRVLMETDLAKLFSGRHARLAFLSDCGQLLSETALTFGEHETLAARIFVSVEPTFFARLLESPHPIGQFVTHVLKNIYLNQTDEENERGRRLLARKAPVADIFPAAYLYRKLIGWLKLFIVASPGIRTLYQNLRPVNVKSLMPLSIVILAWNRWDLTERCLRSIFQFPVPQDSEILVVDNGSTDVTPEALKQISEKMPILKHIRLPNNLGPAGGRDAALPHARGNTLVFLDNDVQILQKEWLDILVEPLILHARVGASGNFGVIHASDEKESWAQKILFPGLVVPVSWTSSFCVAMRRQAVEDAGGWRPDLYPLYGMEDVSMGWALREKSWITAVPSQFVPVMHSMNHRDGHYTYSHADSCKKNLSVFNQTWGPRRRILNLAAGNRTLISRQEARQGAQKGTEANRLTVDPGYRARENAARAL